MPDQHVSSPAPAPPRPDGGRAVERPPTGAEYLESLRDGREVWIYGERVADVTAHPAFRNSARTLARLYDALHDPALRGVLTVDSDAGGTVTHPFFRAPRGTADLRAARDAIAVWQRMTYGWMGRTPDYKASFMATLGADPGFYGPFAANASAWYARAQNRVLFLSHALVDPPVSRHAEKGAGAGLRVRVVAETADGIVVSGAKGIATGAALTQYAFVSHTGPRPDDPAQAVSFVAPLHTPGLKVVCRAGYELRDGRSDSPFDHPLSSRFDENDALLLFDRAVVPWSDVLIHRDVERAGAFAHGSGFLPRFLFHSAVRMSVKLDFLCGLLLKAVRSNGSDVHPGVRSGVGEALAWRHTVHALVTAMTERSEPWARGRVHPPLAPCLAYRVLAPTAYRTVRQLIQRLVAGPLISTVSHPADFRAPGLRPLLDVYLRGADGGGAEERAKLMKLVWDGVGSEFASRHELYESLHAANPEVTRFETYQFAERTGLRDELCGFVDRCLSEYDAEGWTVPYLRDE
ncbi:MULTISPECIES: 4-hydroxyphenylacetate 3-hydroxylase family protein [Streptomyces]|uniref:4-hydroxyphenylacetate 3-hydroxylase family protein n=1 Tax=Streptomyces TaxID=1883 RepID=UPI00163CC6ED|nr:MULTISPECIES: 4-hydroxyphenylacetate 3-hydroxylase N-terminal domain-containing protein [Streptomyces]MBC2875407.1 Pyoverdin chromophore biosynthetic protein pvcC [Streptomyces sp. TYQ1024]UBI35650.1 Pyoverdin chromophore biosynthetic protein pvcC [Streptomyces mobaraensis]UKW28243.1 Pyoverdin chromophore biosynthetic protein pvcC [Streptomyces sp. TYQ1024]